VPWHGRSYALLHDWQRSGVRITRWVEAAIQVGPNDRTFNDEPAAAS
jgi:hypothetical protein